MTRIDAWQEAVQAVADEWAAAPFEYGRYDCASFAAAVVKAQTGRDFYTPFRGKYRSAAGAARALRLYGAGDLPGTLTAALGEPVHPAFAGRGDVVMNEQGNAGLCLGAQSMFIGEGGAAHLPTLSCTMAWKV
jgi:hypothetical protein